jgi:hypothetical protein
MRRCRPDLIAADIPKSGHISFVEEPEALNAIRLWLDQIAESSSE